MDTNIFLPKDDPDIETSYEMTVVFHSGDELKLEDVAHHTIEQVAVTPNGQILGTTSCPILVICTKDDMWHWIPALSIRHIYFDKRWSKNVAVREKLWKERAEKEQREAEIMSGVK